MIRSIQFHGGLADKYCSDIIELDVDTPKMLFLGLFSQFRGLKQDILKDQNYHIITKTGDDVAVIDQDTFEMTLGDVDEIHIISQVDGAGVEVGAAITAYIASITWAGIIVNIAIAIVIGAVVYILAPSPSTSEGNEKDEKPSFLYNGPVNVTAQGYAVPIVYGMHMSGSVVISSGVDIAEIPYVAEIQKPPDGSTQPGSPPSEPWQNTGEYSS